MMTLKSPETEISGNTPGNLNGMLMESDDESNLSHEGLVEEDKLKEIMQELYKEITYKTTSSSYNTSPPLTVTSPSPSSSSCSPPLSFSSLTFFPVSVDVKISESCGASMSNASSTVMAGIEFVGPNRKLPENEIWVKGMGFDENDVVIVGGEEKMKSCDDDDDDEEREVDDDDEQWLARVLGWGPLELEDFNSFT